MQSDREPGVPATPVPNTFAIPMRVPAHRGRLHTRIWSVLSHPLRRFAADQRGLVSTETVLVVPLVIWAFAATFVYFDVFRHVTTGQKAATLIGDTLSRMRDIPVDAQHLERMNALFAYLAEAKHPTNIRVSSIGWNAEEEEYLLIWSYSTGWLSTSGWQPSSVTAPTDEEGRRNYYDAPLTDDVVNGPIGATLPRLVQGETVILVESQIIFEPLFPVGIAGRTLRQQVATRPRFAPQLTFERDGEVVGQPAARPS